MEHIELSDIQSDKSIADQSIAKLKSLSLSADSLCCVLNNIIDNFDDYLPLSGGEMSGDLRILNGNYFQTSDPSAVFDYCDHGGHVEADQGIVEALGNTKVAACVGSLGYCVLSAWNDEETSFTKLKLSGDSRPIRAVLPTTEKWTLALGTETKHGAVVSCIIVSEEETSAFVVCMTTKFLTDDWLTKLPSNEYGYLDLWRNGAEKEQDNVFYSPKYPDAGNQKAPCFYNAHIEGCKTKAIQRCTHAEGRRCVADARYSHAEGSDCRAMGMASHAEGYSTIAYGYGSHVEGYENVVSSNNSHAEGYQCQANGNQSHVGGTKCVASGENSYSFGYNSTANGICSRAIGSRCEANGYMSMALGNQAVAVGQKSYVWSGQIAEGTGSDTYGSSLKDAGIYAVNPNKGIDDFYIGNKSLKDILLEAINAGISACGGTKLTELKIDVS